MALTKKNNSSSSSSSNSTNFPDPYDFVTANPRLTIEFYGYQTPIHFVDLTLCVINANEDVMHEVTAGQGNFPMGPGPYVWTAGGATLFLSPEGEALTWARWTVAPLAIRKFIMLNAYRGTQFILLWRGVGPVGYGQLIAERSQAASLSSSPGTGAVTAVKAIPDPTVREYESIGASVEFYAYREPVSLQALGQCISLASHDIVVHVRRSQAPTRMFATEYTYEVDGVALVLNPERTLTWDMWAFAPVWIHDFVMENELKGTQFILSYVGFGPVAHGELVGTGSGDVPGRGVDAS